MPAVKVASRLFPPSPGFVRLSRICQSADSWCGRWIAHLAASWIGHSQESGGIAQIQKWDHNKQEMSFNGSHSPLPCSIDWLTGREASVATSSLHLTNQRCWFHASHESSHTAGIGRRLSPVDALFCSIFSLGLGYRRFHLSSGLLVPSQLFPCSFLAMVTYAALAFLPLFHSLRA